MTDMVMSNDTEFDFEKATEDKQCFYHKTPVMKKVYAEFLRIQDRYPNDNLIEQCRHNFRQMLNNIDVCESAMSELYQQAIAGILPDEVIPDFVSLLWHWQGKHVNLRKFRDFIENRKKILDKK